MRFAFRVATGALLIAPAALHAQTAVPLPAASDTGVPVFSSSIVDRPYKVLGKVEVEPRKPADGSASPSQTMLYRELWMCAKKLGADAVLIAQYGDMKGIAVKFTAPVQDRR